MLLYTYKVKRKEGEIMFDYFDELIYCADYLDYQDPEYIEKINSDDRCLINSYTMEIIDYLMDHGWDINDNAIDKIQDTLVDFYKTIK